MHFPATERSIRPSQGRWTTTLVVAALAAACAVAPPLKLGVVPTVQLPVPSPLEREVLENPRDPSVRLNLAAYYASGGELFRAAREMEIAQEVGSSDPLLFARLSELYSNLGELPRASAVLQVASRNRGATDSIRTALSQVSLAQGDFHAAAAAVRPLLSSFGALGGPAQRRTARLLILAGDWETAAPLLPQKTSDVEWLALRGYHRLLTGQQKDAVRDLDAATRGAPNDAWNWYLLGQACREAGLRDRAIAAWESCRRLQGAPPRATFRLAAVLAHAGNTERAELVLETVNDQECTDPEFWDIRARLDRQRKSEGEAALAQGRAADDAGDPWGAERVYLQAVSQLSAGSAELPYIYRALVQSLTRRADRAAALPHVLKAVDLWPRDPSFVSDAAEMLLEQNRYPEALAMAQRLRPLLPADQQDRVADLIARIAVDGGGGSELEAAVREGRERNPADPNPYLLLGEWHQYSDSGPGHLDRALEQYQRAVAIAPTNAEAHARLGGLLAEIRKSEEAIEPLLRALSLAPRVMDGAPDVQLAQIYRRKGQHLEAAFHERRYQELRRLKDAWANHLTSLQRGPSAGECRALGTTALARNDAWIALYAFSRGTRLAPRDARCWRGLAAAQRRLGRFEEAISAMRRAHLLARGRQGAEA